VNSKVVVLWFFFVIFCVHHCTAQVLLYFKTIL
jgi:hypothetical protein